MTERTKIGGLQVANVLKDLLENQIAPGTGVDAAHFWSELEKITEQFVPRNRALLEKRDDLQAKIDAWHQARAGQQYDEAEYTAFLKEIGYLLEEPADFTIQTENVDEEIALMAGPQLVVPVDNARYALNAA
ncbi:MAG: malate synthase G, partial [Proteobacteria bacterium]|nr:malate synthase G [Pseudomonadota bacterium]